MIRPIKPIHLSYQQNSARVRILGSNPKSNLSKTVASICDKPETPQIELCDIEIPASFEMSDEFIAEKLSANKIDEPEGEDDDEMKVLSREEILAEARALIEKRQSVNLDWDFAKNYVAQEDETPRSSNPITQNIRDTLLPKFRAELKPKSTPRKRNHPKPKVIPMNRRVTCPWYMDKKDWFKKETIDPKQTKFEDNRLPYDRLKDRIGPDEIVNDNGETIRRLTKAEVAGLEVCQEYRRYLLSDAQKKDGARLPHFLHLDEKNK